MHRDDFICTDCQKKGGILNVHHIKEFHIILEEYNIKDVNGAENCAELWDLNNGVTLCKSCHIKRHKK
jgi:5-methylcytosine-specific restriction endonuclease McrA